MSSVAILPVDHQFTSLVQDLLDHTSSVIYAKDLEFRYLLINRQFETLFHVTRSEIVGKTDFDIFPSQLAREFRANDSKVVESGLPLQCEETAPQDDGLHKYFSMKFPLRDSTGAIYAIAGISTDITDRLRAERVIATLNHRHHLIWDSVGAGICDLDSEGRIVFLNQTAEQMLQQNSAVVQGLKFSEFVVDPWRNGRFGMAPALNPVEDVLGGRATRRVQQASLRRRDDSVLPVEYTVVPIHDMGSIIGAVVMVQDVTARLKQLETEQEIQTAQRIQSSMSPKQVPSIPGFDFAAMSAPCSKACGDYFDFIPCGENRLGIVVGDVSGHGLGAALEMVETRAILRTTMLTESDPVLCLSLLNKILTNDLPDDMFVTLFLAVLKTDDRTLTYAAAGHDAIILSASGVVRRLDSTGAVLGLNSSTVFSGGHVLELQSGDLLLISTDGIAEALSPTHELFGRSRVIDLLRRHQARTASEIADALRVAVDAFRGREPQRDDMTAIVVKVLGQAPRE